MPSNESNPGEGEELGEVITIEVRVNVLLIAFVRGWRETFHDVVFQLPPLTIGWRTRPTKTKKLFVQDCKVGDWVEVKSGRSKPWRGQVKSSHARIA